MGLISNFLTPRGELLIFGPFSWAIGCRLTYCRVALRADGPSLEFSQGGQEKILKLLRFARIAWRATMGRACLRAAPREKPPLPSLRGWPWDAPSIELLARPAALARSRPVYLVLADHLSAPLRLMAAVRAGVTAQL